MVEPISQKSFVFLPFLCTRQTKFDEGTRAQKTPNTKSELNEGKKSPLLNGLYNTTTGSEEGKIKLLKANCCNRTAT
jgi:hypothetical protein